MNLSTDKCSSAHKWRTGLIIGVILVAAISVLMACTRTATPDPATSQVVGGTVPPAPEVQPTTAITSAAMQFPVVTLEPTPDQGLVNTPVLTAATAISGTEAITAAPLVVNTGGDCPIESDLDLAGYDGVEELMGCPLDAATFEPVGINEFGEGPDHNRFMLWFGWEGQIYVLLPGGMWEAHADTWVEGVDTTFSCNPLGGEPTSPPLPRRGFGKLWCEQPDLQEIMGTVEREERLCQHTVVQRFEEGRVVACFEDATVRYFRLMDDNGWHLDIQR